jgi:hypothetical protein
LAYSNSKPTTSSPKPNAAPRSVRFSGVGVMPMKAVTSAAAARGHAVRAASAQRMRKVRRIAVNDRTE